MVDDTLTLKPLSHLEALKLYQALADYDTALDDRVRTSTSVIEVNHCYASKRWLWPIRQQIAWFLEKQQKKREQRNK